jgi:glycosyltransferase involved in cell wall biosynthesis
MRRLLAPPAETVTSGDVPSFSIVIAAYQVADVIGEAIESALDQTAPPHEVVVCDDGSTDGLDGALAPYRDRIVLVRKENGGEASAKNAAARAASGDFVSILDADDVYLPERLAALGELAEARPDLDILTTDAFLELNGDVLRRVYDTDWPFEVEDQRRGILQRNFVFGHAAVRRETLLAAGGFDESIRFTTDWECWIRLILSGSRAGAVLEPLSRYRVREQSLSADRPRMTAGRIQSLRKALEHPSLRPEERAVARATLAGYERELSLHRLREALRQGQSGARRMALQVSLGRRTPFSTRLKGLAAAVAPGLVGRLLRRREEPAWIGAGGTTVERATPPTASGAARRS